MQDDKIAQGYKDSPLGIIPDDWEVKEFGDISKLSKERYVPNKNESLRCLELEHFEQGTGNILGWISSSGQKSTKNRFNKGDLLFGKLRPYLQKYWYARFAGVCSSEIWVLKSNSKKCDISFLFLLIQSNRFFQATNVSSGSKMPRADWNYISTFPFLLPTLPEQQKIAEILTCWDKAIEKQSQLIDKLEIRKCGIMQQLLTGKNRKKEFDKKWKKVRLSVIGKAYSGLTNKNKKDFGKGKPYIPYLNVFNNSKVDIFNFDNVVIEPNEKQNSTQYGDIFFTVSSETQNEVGMSSVLLHDVDELYLNSFCFGLRLNNFSTLLPEFARYFFRSYPFRREVFRLSQGVTRFNLSKNELMKLKIIIPSLEEQTAIANILSTADSEIQAEKEKLTALKSQKKGLMQQLLTGKKRVSI